MNSKAKAYLLWFLILIIGSMIFLALTYTVIFGTPVPHLEWWQLMILFILSGTAGWITQGNFGDQFIRDWTKKFDEKKRNTPTRRRKTTR